MSKILLVKPRFLEEVLQSITQPMGLMYIGAVLKKAGHEVRIHDCALDYRDLQILQRTLQDWKPDFIGISMIVTEIEYTKRVMKIIRGILPNVPVTFGGPWPTANPEEAMKTFGADFVVLGEGELVFPTLIDAVNKRIPTDSIVGTASMVHGHVKVNPACYLTEDELNALPFPAWELLDHKLYAKMHSAATIGRRPYVSLVTSRGCPYKCAFCHHTMGKVFRKRSAESVLAEMEELRFRYGFREFEIIDDCFNLDRDRMYAILNGIKNRLGDVKLHFPNGLRSDLLEPSDMVLFKQAGTVSAVFAIETSSPRIQKMIHKNLNIRKAEDVIKSSAKAGIYSMGTFMVGFPTETYKEASGTVEFAIRSPLHRALFIRPLPFAGTEMAEMVADFFKFKKDTFDRHEISYLSSNLNISAVPDRDLRSIFIRAYLRFYFSPKRILRLIIYHPNFLSLPYYAFLAFTHIMLRLIKNTKNYKMDKFLFNADNELIR